MRIETKQRNNINVNIPVTDSFERADFNSISHFISDNKYDKERMSKYGTYSIEFSFAHDDYATTSVCRGKTIVRAGGIDKRLTSISNLKLNGAGLTTLKGSLRKYHKSTKHVDDIWSFFKEELSKLVVNRRRPVHFTGAIKHKSSKQILDNAAVMLVEQDNNCLLVFVVIGNVKYRFQTTRGGSFSEKQSFGHSRFTAYNNDEHTVDWYEEDDEFTLDEFEEYQVEEQQNNTSSSARTTVKKQLEICFFKEVVVQVDQQQAQSIIDNSFRERLAWRKANGFNDELDDLLEGIDFNDI
ncbi:TPA: hypothetical protein ACP5S6_002842 [Vibrio parahaemolyticus]